jgi:hypothetical protein
MILFTVENVDLSRNGKRMFSDMCGNRKSRSTMLNHCGQNNLIVNLRKWFAIDVDLDEARMDPGTIDLFLKLYDPTIYGLIRYLQRRSRAQTYFKLQCRIRLHFQP